MNHSKLIQQSTAFSCVVHVTALLAMSVMPLALTDRLTISGQREVISIEITMATPSPSAVASVYLPTEQETVESKTLQEMRRVEPTKPDLSLPEPDFSSLSQTPTAERVERDRELPTVTTPTMVRPRRTLSIAAPPSVTVPKIPNAAGDPERKAEFLSNPPPKYPAAAVASRSEGTVLLKLYVDDCGKVERVEVVESSGSQLLDQAAMDAVIQWIGKPAIKFGRPVASTEVLPIRFRL